MKVHFMTFCLVYFSSLTARGKLNDDYANACLARYFTDRRSKLFSASVKVEITHLDGKIRAMSCLRSTGFEDE